MCLFKLPPRKGLEEFKILWVPLHQLKERDGRIGWWRLSLFIFLKGTFATTQDATRPFLRQVQPQP